tara:strand:+ start:578 stop:883 length:306 start_codon:yes stop_codon:yes gene_type:complete
MPRSENKNTYHFKVKQINNATYKYYHTAKAITEDLGIPRSSIYKIMSRDTDTKYYTYPFIKIDKISVPKENIIKEIYELKIRNLIEQKYNDELSAENWLSV